MIAETLAITVVVRSAVTAATAAIAVTAVTVDIVAQAGLGRQELTARTARAVASIQARRAATPRLLLLLCKQSIGY